MAISNIKTLSISGLQLIDKPLPEESVLKPGEIFAPEPEPPHAAIPADNAAENRYAYIFRGNEIIGEVYNSGGVSFYKNSDASQVQLTEEGFGPDLAQKRAEEIAEALGGSIVKAGTAMDQATWLKTPAAERIMGAEAFAKQMQMAAESKYNAQMIAQTQERAAAINKAKADAAVKEFMEFMEMSTAERIRAMVLLEMGISEEDIKKLDSKKQKEVEDEIAQRIKDKVERGLAHSDDQHEKNNEPTMGKMEASIKVMTDKAIENAMQVHATDEIKEVNDGAKTLGLVLDKYNLSSSALQKKRSPLFDDA